LDISVGSDSIAANGRKVPSFDPFPKTGSTLWHPEEGIKAVFGCNSMDFFSPLTTNLEYQIKSNYKIISTTPV